jgi:outer membrane murein-binding lipoprotein Lpp
MAVNKNTAVGASVGTLAGIVAVTWTALGIGRPLFASDLERIEAKIDNYQTSTAVQILSIRKEALQSELRAARRDLRADPSDQKAMRDIDDIKTEIDDLVERIKCHRTEGCDVNGGF